MPSFSPRPKGSEKSREGSEKASVSKVKERQRRTVVVARQVCEIPAARADASSGGRAAVLEGSPPTVDGEVDIPYPGSTAWERRVWLILVLEIAVVEIERMQVIQLCMPAHPARATR